MIMIFLLIRASSYNIFIVWEILKAAVLPSLNSKWEIQEISKPLPNLNIGLSQAQTLNCFVITSFSNSLSASLLYPNRSSLVFLLQAM